MKHFKLQIKAKVSVKNYLLIEKIRYNLIQKIRRNANLQIWKLERFQVRNQLVY